MTVQTDNMTLPTDKELLERMRYADDEAVTILYNRYAERLLNLVGRRIAPHLQALFDPDDISISVFDTVARRAQDGQFSLEDDNDLWKLLVTIGLNKVRKRVRESEAQCRDVHRRVPLTAPDGREGPHIKDERGGLSHEDRTELDEIFQKLRERLDDGERTILELRLAGMKQSEIAARTNFSEKTVGRYLNKRIPAKAREWFTECFDDAE